MTESSRAFTLANSESNKFLTILSCTFNNSFSVAIVTSSDPAESAPWVQQPSWYEFQA